MKQILVCFSIFVIFMFPFSTVVQASNTNIDYDAMSEYDGFAKAVFDSYVTGTTYIAGKYTNNLQYVNETISQVKQNANSLWEGFKNEDCGEGCNWGWEFIKKLLAGGATAIDVVKDFFTSENEDRKILDYSFWNDMFIVTGTTINPSSNYEMVVTDSRGNITVVETTHVTDGLRLSGVYDEGTLRIGSGNNGVYASNSVLYNHASSLLDGSVSGYMSMISLFGGVTVFPRLKSTGETLPAPDVEDGRFASINNYIQNNPNLINPNYKPSIDLQLVCPSGVTSALDVVGSAIKMNDFTLQVDKTTSQTNFNGENCIVQFVPVAHQVTDDGLVVVDGIDIETGLPAKVGAGEIDYSLVDYVSNAYNYATTVISSGVNGLRSIIAGTAGLVTFSGSLFAFLPPEIMALFIGGFSVALGLWVFKK